MNSDTTIAVQIQEKPNNTEVLHASARKLEDIASKLAEIFRVGFEAGIISANKTAFLGTKDYIDNRIGEVDTVLDSILAIQESLIGGEA